LTDLGGTAVVTMTGSSLNDTLIGNFAGDTLTGGLGIDTFIVNAGKETIGDLGKGGADVLIVGAGAIVNNGVAAAWTAGAGTINNGSVTLITGGLAIDVSASGGNSGYYLGNYGAATVLTGSAMADTLSGGNGNDTLLGGGGNDVLNGGTGNDTMTGGTGVDYFAFNSAPDSVTNLDVITDFVSGQDVVQFSKRTFTGVAETGVNGAGTPLAAASELLISPTATVGQTAAQHFIYNTASGVLYYDATGTGASIAVAQLGTSTHPTLSYSDIHIIG
jgi:serralysin